MHAYQRYQALVKQFILKATKTGLYELCQTPALEKHLETLCSWAQGISMNTPSFQLQAPPVAQVTNHHQLRFSQSWTVYM